MEPHEFADLGPFLTWKNTAFLWPKLTITCLHKIAENIQVEVDDELMDVFSFLFFSKFCEMFSHNFKTDIREL